MVALLIGGVPPLLDLKPVSCKERVHRPFSCTPFDFTSKSASSVFRPPSPTTCVYYAPHAESFSGATSPPRGGLHWRPRRVRRCFLGSLSTARLVARRRPRPGDGGTSG